MTHERFKTMQVLRKNGAATLDAINKSKFACIKTSYFSQIKITLGVTSKGYLPGSLQ